jgi:hypothetical protein
MALTALILFGSALIGGLAVKLMNGRTINLNLPLIFAGSFLFAITVIHILPELFSISESPRRIAIFVLVGFFFQRLLEYFSRGVEHGHAHAHASDRGIDRFYIVMALVIHAMLEGALLTHESPFHQQHESHSLLMGVALHHIPAAFALMVTMAASRWKWFILVVFAASAPAGMFLSHAVTFSFDFLLVLFALVCGSFLHISTTIFVESSPEHRFGFLKLITSVAGAGVAVLAEFFF